MWVRILPVIHKIIAYGRNVVSKMDKDDSLFLYIGGIPKKNRLDNEWITKELRITDAILLDKDLFPEVQWSDDEPTKVKLIIDK